MPKEFHTHKCGESVVITYSCLLHGAEEFANSLCVASIFGLQTWLRFSTLKHVLNLFSYKFHVFQYNGTVDNRARKRALKLSLSSLRMNPKVRNFLCIQSNFLWCIAYLPVWLFIEEIQCLILLGCYVPAMLDLFFWPFRLLFSAQYHNHHMSTMMECSTICLYFKHG